MRIVFVFFTLFLVGFDNVRAFERLGSVGVMPKMTDGEELLSFTCKYEVLPVADGYSDVLFKYARWMQKSNQLKQNGLVDLEVERLYRIAAEHDHVKANINLQNGAIRGGFKLLGQDHLRLSTRLIEKEVAAGFCFIAIFLQQGNAGLEEDKDLAFRYFYEAALRGNAQAQFYIGEQLAPIDVAPETSSRMYRCAAEQGDGAAAVALGVRLKRLQSFEEALRVFQLGVKAGHESAASFLEGGFRDPSPSDNLYYLGQTVDLERADRYKKIWRILANYSYANPVVPEIDEILPLPPATLPPWDGKIQWLEERLANIPPPKPEEWLIEKLAKEKGLDPATGRPQPGSPAFKAEYFPADTCRSGEPCPQEGYWKVMWPESWVHNEEIIQHFNEGDLMPNPEGNYYIHRVWPLPRKLVQGQIAVEWGLLG